MDPVADVLIRIKNGYSVNRTEVGLMYSKLAIALCALLKKEGFISDYKQKDRELVAVLKYDNRVPALSGVKRVSKPGLRIYKGVKDLPRVLNGFGVVIISTPKGLMTDKNARHEKVGGEVMAEVW